MSELNQVLLHESNRIGADLDAWLSGAGGKGLEKALRDVPSIIPAIRDAGLRGLGGSGFPTYKKWEYVAAQDNGKETYLICTGNEDEPATFSAMTAD